VLDPVVDKVDRLIGDYFHPQFSGKLPNLPDCWIENTIFYDQKLFI
jgi:hypothetical protein